MAAGLLMAAAAPAATYDLANASQGATAAYNGNPGFYGGAVGYTIDGVLSLDHNNTASWSNELAGTDGQKAWIRINLPPQALEMTLQRIKLYDRQSCCQHAAPFTLTVYDGTDAAIEMFSANTNQLAYTFTPAGSINTASYLVYQHTGASAQDLFIPELDAFFTGDFAVGGPGIGSTALRETTLVGGVAGPLAGVQAVRIAQNRNTYLEFSEMEAISGGVDVSSGGVGSGNDPWGNAAQLVDGDLGSSNGLFLVTGSNPDYYLTNALGVTLPAATLDSVRYYQRNISRTGFDYQHLQLEAYSDAARTTLIYSRPVAAGSNAPGHWESFDFLFGGTAWATLDAGETYRFQIDGDTLAADQLAVWQMTGSQTGLDLNGATARVELIAGTIEAGDTFHLLAADAIAGEFGEWILPALAGGLEWDLAQIGVAGTIQAVQVIPEPASLVLVGLAGLCVAGRRRRA